MLTTQQIFDITTTHLFAQNGERSLRENGKCAYRSSSKSTQLATSRCAVGLYIKDEVYHKELEGARIRLVMKGSSGYLDNAAYTLLVELQLCHDFYTSNDVRLNYLNRIAVNFKLDVRLANLLFADIIPESPLSNQTVFDAVMVWLWAQGDGKCGSNDICYYRQKNDVFARTRCAAGLFIPDDKYDAQEMEEQSCRNIPIFRSIVGDLDFLQRLQAAHDSDGDDRIRSLRVTIKEYNLNPDIANILFNFGV